MSRELEDAAVAAYRAPEHDDEPSGHVARRRAALFEVSISTLVVLHLITLGLYAIFWFYEHWRLLKAAHRLSISPLARGVFAIFFAHRLFRAIDETARGVGVSPTWNPSSQASLYVLLLILGRLGDALATGDFGLGLAFLLGVASIYPLARAQQVANLANAELSRHEPENEDEDEDEDEDKDEDEGEGEGEGEGEDEDEDEDD